MTAVLASEADHPAAARRRQQDDPTWRPMFDDPDFSVV